MNHGPTLRALLGGAIDYAGLFPPAELTLEPALKNYADYLRTDDAWMLGAFVLPTGKFEAAEALLGQFDEDYPLRIAALGPKTENAEAFMEALRKMADAIREFNARHKGVARVEQIEMALPAQPGVHLAEANSILGDLDLPTSWEAPADEAERVIAFLSERRRTGAARFRFKLRTGGVIAAAFPSSVQIARALVAAVHGQVPIKFTAGLHHPVRAFHPSVQTKMHGFVNVFSAGVLGAEHGWDVQQTARLLDNEDASEFVFSGDGLVWKEFKISPARILVHRTIVRSFGSCSFDEPREDLRALNLL